MHFRYRRTIRLKQENFSCNNNNEKVLKNAFYNAWKSIRGVINSWFSSYLRSRAQTAYVGSFTSNKVNTLCGVPQGSVLGPLLFLLYINDIRNCSDKLKFYLFADDPSLLYANRDLKSLEKTVNAELLKFCEWHGLLQKSNYVIFRPHKRILSYQPKIWVFDNNNLTFF